MERVSRGQLLSVMTFRRSGRHEGEPGAVSQEHGGQ